MPFAVDELNSDRVVGWAFDGRRSPEVTIVVDGRTVGRVATGAYRSDVANALGDDRAAHSGFEFVFEADHFRHVTGRDAAVLVQVGRERTEAARVPVIRDSREVSLHGPFPPGILSLLARYRDDYSTTGWDDEIMLRAVADLRFLLERGPRATPDLHAHLIFLGELWIRAASVERYFPRENTDAAIEAKDRSAVQNSALEVFSIAAHLATLRAHGLSGPFLEFGCFKGFSTAILSDACHHLELEMHVFDSFAGLPPSSSTYYSAGDFTGSRAEVEASVASYGSLEPVTFHEGFFAETLPDFTRDRVCCIWMDVDLESSSRDVMAVLPRLDRRGAVFSHEVSRALFTQRGLELARSPEGVVPPIVDAFRENGRPLAARHLHGHTGAFWDGSVGIPPLSVEALLSLRDIALAL